MAVDYKHTELTAFLLRIVNNSLPIQPSEKSKLKMLLEIPLLLEIIWKKATPFPCLLHTNLQTKVASFKRKQLLTFYISVFILFTGHCLQGNDIFFQLRNRKYIEKEYSWQLHRVSKVWGQITTNGFYKCTEIRMKFT